VRAFAKDIPYDDYKNTQVYQSTQAGRMRNRGTLFSVTDEFVQWLIHRLLADGDEESAAILQLGKGSCRSV
jgi:hypothetical protein